MRKAEVAATYFLFCIMLFSLIPVMYLGRYNHPVGDDYYYGADARTVWEKTGSLFETAKEAAKGVAHQYQNWQGTYSSMFLMCLPPNTFAEWGYQLVTSVILILLSGGIFYMMKPLVCVFLGGSSELWLLSSSLLTLLCIQTIPSQGEAFFWYNGSMYYTGYFSISLFFFGLLFRHLMNPRRFKLAIIFILAVFLAGGNYVTLMPVILLLLLLTAGLAHRRSAAWKHLGLTFVLLLAGLSVSALAPGNQIRQAGLWKIPAWKAVAKSLLQGIYYFEAWTSVWLFLALIVWTPFLWKAFAKTSCRFPCPLLAIGLAYGLFCSMSCPMFYAMNSTGPARAIAVIHYGFIFTALFLYAYLLGYLYRIIAERKYLKRVRGKTPLLVGLWITICAVLLIVQIVSGALEVTTTGKAVKLLADGTAAAYGEEYRQRLLILRDEKVRDVVFEPYKNTPDMLYVGEDFGSNPQNPGNRKAAQYFHKDSLCVAY